MLEFLADFQDIALLFARVFLGSLFIVHGKPKMMGPKPGIDGFSSYLKGLGFPVPTIMAIIVATVEFWGGIMLILGVFTRLVASLMAITMIAATYVNIERNEKSFKGGWELDMIILGVCFLLMAFGPGAHTFFQIFVF